MEVLVDRYARFVDDLKGVIQETEELSPYEAMKRAISGCINEEEREKAIQTQLRRYPEEVEEPAFAILRERKASRPGGASAVRKEPVTFTCADADYFHDILDGIEPCLSQVVAGAGAADPSLTSVSLNISWPPGHCQRDYPATAFIASCHQSLLVVCVGNCRPSPRNRAPGFYLVYDARASSVAIVPPLNWCGGVDIAGATAGAAVLRLAGGTTEGRDDDGYLLAELHLRIDDLSYLPTNKATLFTWESLGCGGGPTTACRWLQREVVLPLPLPADEGDFFCADMVFAVGSTSLCWVDLLKGILVYNHTAAAAGERSPFHFIPLPEGCAVASSIELMGDRVSEETRSMCCVDGGEAFRFVAMGGYYDEGGDIPSRAELTLTTWVLHHPLSSTKIQWQKDASFRVGDLSWDDDDPAVCYVKDRLMTKLQPLAFSFPVISTLQPGDGIVVYLSLTDYEYNRRDQVLDATGLYVLSIDMHRRRVLSVLKVPPLGNGTVRHQRLFPTRIESADT